MLDRALQHRILATLATLYPEGTFDMPAALASAGAGPHPDERAVLVNTHYLAEHGLAVSGYVRRGTIGDDSFIPLGEHCITAKGLDFLADDGGLGAILGAVTIRIDATQWAEMLARKVEAAQGLSHADRSSVAAALRSLPAKAIGTVSEKLLDWAVDHAQDALPLLRMWLAQAAG